MKQYGQGLAHEHLHAIWNFERSFLVYNCYKIILSDLCHEVDF